MFRRTLVIVFAAVLALTLSACSNKRAHNPIADVDSKQPDKVLFDRAMEMLRKNRFDQARMVLQTLINTYPDSEFVARAKLGIADSWYAEGGSAAWAQAESEYKDFKTFFPNMAEAAEAQLKVANIHFEQMEKPDRDYTHAKRAEQEYRELILEYPDSQLVPQAKERLRMVQEVLAEREFRIGRFYYMRESWAAGIARLKSLTDTYELYSQADEALFMIGDAYERWAATTNAWPNLPEDIKGRLVNEYLNNAEKAYNRIITRYPITNRAVDARARLKALMKPVPEPTQEMLAQNKAEEESRQRLGMFGRTMMNFHKRPDTSQTARVGDPTLTDPRPTSAPDLTNRLTQVMKGALTGEGSQSVSVEKVGTGQPGPNDPTPRSDQQTPEKTGIPELTPIASDSGNGSAAPATQQQAASQPANSPTPAASSAPTTPTPAKAPAQVNDATTHPPTAEAQSKGSGDTREDESSSKKKKKKKFGLF